MKSRIAVGLVVAAAAVWSVSAFAGARCRGASSKKCARASECAAASECGAGGKAACASVAPSAQAKSEHTYGMIDTAGLQSLTRSGADVVLVDARTPKYDDGQRIPGALTLPAGSSDEQILSVLPDKDALVVAYCSNLKCPASAKLAAQLVALGYNNVVKYPEGLAGWLESGNEVTKGDG